MLGAVAGSTRHIDDNNNNNNNSSSNVNDVNISSSSPGDALAPPLPLPLVRRLVGGDNINMASSSSSSSSPFSSFALLPKSRVAAALAAMCVEDDVVPGEGGEDGEGKKVGEKEKEKEKEQEVEKVAATSPRCRSAAFTELQLWVSLPRSLIEEKDTSAAAAAAAAAVGGGGGAGPTRDLASYCAALSSWLDSSLSTPELLFVYDRCVMATAARHGEASVRRAARRPSITTAARVCAAAGAALRALGPALMGAAGAARSFATAADARQVSRRRTSCIYLFLSLFLFLPSHPSPPPAPPPHAPICILYLFLFCLRCCSFSSFCCSSC